jgi:Na+/phosphate symporter
MTDEAHAVFQLDNAVISVQFIGGLLMSAMAWWVKRQDGRITDLEKQLTEKVDKEAHGKAHEELRRDVREALAANIEAVNRSSQITIDAITKVHERVDKIFQFIAEKK